MKRTPLVIAALAPVVALAAQHTDPPYMDHQQLRSHVQATSMLGAEVQSGEGRSVGTVEDIVFDQQGNISSVLVQREGTAAASEGNSPRNEVATGVESAAVRADAAVARGAQRVEEEWEAAAAADEGEADYVEARERGTDMAAVRAERRERTNRADNEMNVTEDSGGSDGRLAKLQWSEINYNAEEQVLRMSVDALQAVQFDPSDAQPAQGEVRASQLVGLEVNLADEESFGEVEDVMIDPGSGKASALVVDSMEFFDKERYALPVELEGLDRDEESLTLQMTQQEVEEIGEFEMDAASTR